jgi:hypothetical protein
MKKIGQIYCGGTFILLLLPARLAQDKPIPGRGVKSAVDYSVYYPSSNLSIIKIYGISEKIVDWYIELFHYTGHELGQ